jgi:hypothetical protein
LYLAGGAWGFAPNPENKNASAFLFRLPPIPIAPYSLPRRTTDTPKKRPPMFKIAGAEEQGVAVIKKQWTCSITSVIEQIPYKTGKMRSILRDLFNNPNPPGFSTIGC